MRHQNKVITPWPEPTYTPMTNIREMIQDIDRDITKHYATNLENHREELKKYYENDSKQLKEIREKNIASSPIGFPFIYGSKYPPILIDKTNRKRSTSVAFPKKSSMSGTSKESSRNEIKFNHRFTNPASYVITESVDQMPYFEIPLYRKLKQKALTAQVEKKIFTVYGNYITIRKALIQRGWVEKIESNYLRNLQPMTLLELVRNVQNGNDYEKMTLSKFVSNYPSYFIWQPRNYRDNYASVKPYRNRIRLSKELDFSTKVGLISCAEHSRWYTINGVAEVKYPRFYSLSTEADRRNFLLDYRVTQALSLLTYIYSVKDITELFDSQNGQIDLKVITFAIANVENTIKLTDEIIEPSNVNEKDKWRQFFNNSIKIINKEAKFHAESDDFLDAFSRCKITLNNAKRYYKTLHMDGHKNLWIVKPGYQCRGSGIIIFNDYEAIMSFINKNPRNRYVAQKYIEKPLLIYNTKFDIRQYLLVTFTDKINIWLYQDCYFRFSSQEFTLNDLRESIHLTNNSIQRKYPNGKRNPKLPRQNMWNLCQYQQYLKEIGKPDAWDKITYPGIKRTVTGIILTSLEATELTKNAFELYGCDFMLDDNFEPILIEINATPDMSPSTAITAKICPATLDDLVKVVVDLPSNKDASTGNFELIYQIDSAITTSNLDGVLAVGTKIKVDPKTIVAPVITKEQSKPGNSKYNLSQSQKKLNINSKKTIPNSKKPMKVKKSPTPNRLIRPKSKSSQRLEQRNHKKNLKKRKTVFAIYPYRETTVNI